MPQLTTSPSQVTTLRLEARRSCAILVDFKKQDDGPVDLTSSALRFTMKQPKRKGGALLVTKLATEVDLELGLMRVDLQNPALDLPAGTYPFTMVLTSPHSYSSVVIKGDVEIIENTDDDETLYVEDEIVPPIGLSVLMRDRNRITVKVNHHPDTVLLAFTDRAEAAASAAQISAGQAAGSADVADEARDEAVSAAAAATAAAELLGPESLVAQAAAAAANTDAAAAAAAAAGAAASEATASAAADSASDSAAAAAAATADLDIYLTSTTVDVVEVLTQAAYNALAVKVATTLYVIVG